MIYNIYNEVFCDYNCKDCNARSYCIDKIDIKEEEKIKNNTVEQKIVDYKNS